MGKTEKQLKKELERIIQCRPDRLTAEKIHHALLISRELHLMGKENGPS